MKRNFKRAQSITEYVALFMIVTAAIALTHKYVYRSMNARLKQVQEELDPASARETAVTGNQGGTGGAGGAGGAGTGGTGTGTGGGGTGAGGAGTGGTQDPNCPGGVGCPAEQTVSQPTQQEETCRGLCRAFQIISRLRGIGPK